MHGLWFTEGWRIPGSAARLVQLPAHLCVLDSRWGMLLYAENGDPPPPGLLMSDKMVVA